MDSKEGLGGGGFMVLGGKYLRESKNACEEVRGVEKMSLMGSKFMVRGKECLEGCVGAGGGEVNRELMEEPFDSRLEVIGFGMEEMPSEGL
ncbi:hypothetical protein Tco_0543104 [Tanacetum coccineum]